MRSETRRSGKLAACAALLAALSAAGLSAPEAGGRQKGSPKQHAQRPDAGQTFARARFMLDNNDTSDEAARLFRQVIEWHPGSREAEEAQFYLGNYYQRKFQIKAQKGEQDWAALAEARAAYEGYARRYPNGGPCDCLADAYFNLALVNMQSGEGGVARDNLSKMKQAQAHDPYVYVYQVSWSGSQKDIVDAHFETGRLAAYAHEVTNMPFEQAGLMLKRWCMSEKSRPKAWAPAPLPRSAAPRREA